jgi:hypothetical protein
MSLDERVAFVHVLVTNSFAKTQTVSVDGGMHPR